MIVLDACTKYQNLQIIRRPEPPCDLKLGALNRTRPRYKQQLGQRLPRCRARKKSVQCIIVCAVLHLRLARMTGQAICRCLCASFNSIATPWLEIRCYEALLKHGNIVDLRPGEELLGFGTVVPGKSCEVFVFSLLGRKLNRRDTKLRRGFAVNLSFSYYRYFTRKLRGKLRRQNFAKQTVAGFCIFFDK